MNSHNCHPASNLSTVLKMKSRRFVIAAACLLTSVAAFAQNTEVDQSADAQSTGNGGIHLTLLKQFTFPAGVVDPHRAYLALGPKQVYISSPSGSVLATPSLTPSSKLSTIFHPDARWIDKIYVYDNTLYVLSSPRFDHQDDHTLFQSTDGGEFFQTIDQGLWECSLAPCRYLYSTQLIARNGLLFVNAGGGENLLVSNDDGKAFDALSGGIVSQQCYHNSFDIIGRTVLMGGECGLDVAYLLRGGLSADKQTLQIPLQPVQSPFLGNRKINMIAHKPGTPLVLAANEGGLLRSLDDGQSFQYVYEYQMGEPLYPYVGSILFDRSRDLTVIGGFNKSLGSGTQFLPYLAYGTKSSSKWTDISYLLTGNEGGTVSDLAQDKDGRLLAVVVDDNKRTVSIFQVIIPNQGLNQ
jgi:hypothetical protein